MEPWIFDQGAPNTEQPNRYPPPLSRGSGVVVESPLLDPVLFCQAVREQLDVHIQRKRRQLLWGLPHIIQSSLERSLPVLPGFLVCTALQESNGHQRPLFKAERRQCLERHMREKTMHHNWGLPWRIQKALQWPFPPAPSLHSVLKEDLVTAARAWDVGVEGSKSVQRRGPATELAEETLSLDLVPLHLLMPAGQQEALLVPSMGELSGDCSQSSLATPWLSVSAPSAEQVLQSGVLSITGEPRPRLDFQDWDRQQQNRPKPGISNDTTTVGRLPFAQAAHLQAKLAEATKRPFPLSEASPQGCCNLTDSQDLRARASYTSGPWLKPFVHTEKSITGAQEKPSMVTLWPGKGPLDQSLSLQPSVQLEVGQMQSMQDERVPASKVLAHQDCVGLAGYSSGVSCQEPHLINLGKTCCRPSPARAQQGAVPITEEGMGSRVCSSQATQISMTSSEANQGSQGAKSFPAGDKKQYFEFHMREKLLHHRWGLPKRVQESLARSILLKAAR